MNWSLGFPVVEGEYYNIDVYFPEFGFIDMCVMRAWVWCSSSLVACTNRMTCITDGVACLNTWLVLVWCTVE